MLFSWFAEYPYVRRTYICGGHQQCGMRMHSIRQTNFIHGFHGQLITTLFALNAIMEINPNQHVISTFRFRYGKCIPIPRGTDLLAHLAHIRGLIALFIAILNTRIDLCGFTIASVTIFIGHLLGTSDNAARLRKVCAVDSFRLCLFDSSRVLGEKDDPSRSRSPSYS